MIATVKIAPVEQWCEHIKQVSRNTLRDLIVGHEVSIDTASMTVAPKEPSACRGKNWLLTPQSQLEIDEILFGRSIGPSWFCEHMLEMD